MAATLPNCINLALPPHLDYDVPTSHHLSPQPHHHPPHHSALPASTPPPSCTCLRPPNHVAIHHGALPASTPPRQPCLPNCATTPAIATTTTATTSVVPEPIGYTHH
ncbi:hypothetical protein EDB89DRAFT_1911660 [Lactarius sanguifluus]|nr:hypothetical protein EDB89DRAFT_1911660 [Lactarius sanguifluus]